MPSISILSTVLDSHYNILFRDKILQAEQCELEEGEENYYFSSKQNGILFVLSTYKVIISISLFSEGFEGYKKFVINDFHDINFDTSKVEIRKKFGIPLKFSKGGMMPILGEVPDWDLYWHNFLNTYLHFQYSEDQRIEMLTLSRKDTEERLKDL
ncbi:MAG: hypothetical protein AAGG68_03995 [Bacteroidota bacterium]